MALTWRSILSSGSVAMNDQNKLQKLTFNLSVAPSQSAAALLMISSLNVDYELSFITMNMENAQANGDLPLTQANDHDSFVSSIFRSGEYWNAQTHRVKPGILTAGNNDLRIHARAENGSSNEVAFNIDNFKIARVFLLYTIG